MKTVFALLSAIVCLSPTWVVAADEDPCSKFTWDVTRELAVMRQEPTPLHAGAKIEQAPIVEPEKLYDLKLDAQSDVTFPVVPGKPMLADGAHAGIVKFRVTKSGNYRVAMASAHWVDVVDGNKLIRSRDFQGQRGCERPHKIVEFTLPADRDLALQLSGATADHVLVSITAAP
jgi:hypothetical protein